jgi:oligoribonuclease
MGKQVIKNLVWLDLEMTGLDLRKDKIIQVAVIVTDTELNILDEKGFVRYIHIEDHDVEGMEEVVREMHTENGVIEKCLGSEYTLEDVDREVVEYISQFIGPKESPLCGSGIGTDKAFIRLYMPHLMEYIHYKTVDVSTLKTLNRMWSVDVFEKNVDNHDALDDIREAIREMQYLRETILKI